MSIIEKIKSTTVPSLFTAAASVGVFYFVVDDQLTIDIPFAGAMLPAGVVVAASAFIGNTIGNIASDFVAPHLPLESLQGLEKTLLPASMAGLGTYAAMALLVSTEIKFMDTFIVGGGGSLIGQQLYNAY
jgi:hypothetical protein